MLSGIGPGSLLLILVIVILLFGTKKLRNVGTDLGGALRSFRKAVKDDEGNTVDAATDTAEKQVIEAEFKKKED